MMDLDQARWLFSILIVSQIFLTKNMLIAKMSRFYVTADERMPKIESFHRFPLYRIV